MSMADDHKGSYRSDGPYRPGSEPPRGAEQARASDPLAELARLIGQSDPFAEFGRSNSRQTQHETQAAPATSQDEWQYAQARDQRHNSDSGPRREEYAPHLGFSPTHEQQASSGAKAHRRKPHL